MSLSPLLCLVLGHLAADSSTTVSDAALDSFLAPPTQVAPVAPAPAAPAQVAPVAPAQAAPAPVADPVPAVPAPVPEPVAATPPARRTTAERFGAWQVGLAAGGASGSGISLRRWWGDADAIQINVAPYVSRTNHPGSEDPNDENRLLDSGFVLDASLIAGVSWLHQIVQVPLFRDGGELKVLSYVAGSTDLSVEQQQMDRWTVKEDGVTRVRWYDDYYRTKREFRIGGGGGCELSRWRLSTSLMFGLAGWYEDVSGDFGVQPDAQLGVHFRF